jgi:hypothetical protein
LYFQAHPHARRRPHSSRTEGSKHKRQ